MSELKNKSVVKSFSSPSQNFIQWKHTLVALENNSYEEQYCRRVSPVSHTLGVCRADRTLSFTAKKSPAPRAPSQLGWLFTSSSFRFLQCDSLRSIQASWPCDLGRLLRSTVRWRSCCPIGKLSVAQAIECMWWAIHLRFAPRPLLEPLFGCLSHGKEL